MCRAFVSSFIAAFLLASCSTGYRVPTGEQSVLSPDGLHKVAGVRKGNLYIRPNYVFGSYESFTLAPTVVSFKQGSQVLDRSALEELSGRFKSVARTAITSTGREEVPEAGPCVAQVKLGLSELELLPPDQVPPADAAGVRRVGAVTLVLEVRDGYTREALLRYGRREDLESRATRLQPDDLTKIFERLAVRFQREFEQVVSRVTPAEPPLSCTARAGQLEG